MRESLFVRLLPPPNFLLMPTFGIDISDRVIRVALFTESSGGLKIQSLAEYVIPEGVVVGGRIEQVDELARLFKDLVKAYNIKYAAMSLPEDLSYVVTMSLPSVNPKDIRESVELQLEEYVPVEAKDVSFDVDIFKSPTVLDSTFEVAVGVTSKREVVNSLELCKREGVILRSIEIESQSLARSLVKKGDKGTYMIVDFGQRMVSFVVVSKGLVVSTSSVPSLGGSVLTKVIQKNMEASYEEAEQLKMEKGLVGVDKKSDLFFSMMAHIASLRDEVTTRLDYWQSGKRGISNPEPVTKIILCGAQAPLPGLVDYLSESLNVEVEMGNPWINVIDLNKRLPPLPKLESIRFAKAIGLALRHIAYGH